MPRASLSPALLIAEAARLADAVGFDQLSLAAVARRFGVAVPSLYKHVGGLAGLRRGLAVLAVRELGAALAAAGEGSPGERLRAMAEAYRDYARAHPGRYQATLRAPEPGDAEHRAASDAVLATIFDALAPYGLGRADAVDATRVLRAALHGFVALESEGAFGLPRDVDRSFARLVDVLDSAVRHWSGDQPPK